MITRNRMHILTLVFMSLFILPPPSGAETNLIFILDGSNSMWGQVDGVEKIETARAALINLVNVIPNETNVGLMSYGLFSKDSCDDVHYLVTTNMNDRKEISEFVNNIQPKGKTPIAKSLEMAGARLRLFKEDDNHIVLISDGIESCGGDPCAVAGQLRGQGIDVRVHVVGFDVDNEADKQLACIASAGGGKYFQARSADGFKEAITEVNKEVQIAESPPEPKPTGPKEFFRDDFDGEELAEHWEVLNPNPDTFILEDGKLVVISAVPANITDEKVENTFRLTNGMPNGDWDAVVKVIPEIQTLQESMSLSYMKDGKNRLTATLDFMPHIKHSHNQYLNLIGQKFSKGNVTTFQIVPIQKQGAGLDVPGQLTWFKDNARAVYLKIAKRGRSYVVSAKIEGDATTKDGKQPEWVSLQKLTSLRPPGTNLVLSFPQRAKTNGESIIAVDWMKIETISTD